MISDGGTDPVVLLDMELFNDAMPGGILNGFLDDETGVSWSCTSEALEPARLSGEEKAVVIIFTFEAIRFKFPRLYGETSPPLTGLMVDAPAVPFPRPNVLLRTSRCFSNASLIRSLVSLVIIDFATFFVILRQTFSIMFAEKLCTSVIWSIDWLIIDT